MKKALLLLFFISCASSAFCQFGWSLDFDNPTYMDRIVRDTVSNPACSWQIGTPVKTIFNAAYSAPRALMTDTANAVPPNDTSRFYLIHQRDNNQPFHVFVLHFWYQMDGDSTDMGIVEVSPDSGQTWVNILKEDTTYAINWLGNPKPSLKGNFNGWQKFTADLYSWASGMGNFPVQMTADTILIRFTYITDSNSVPHDGWMIDDILVEDWFESVEDVRDDALIAVYPNPASDRVTFELLHAGKAKIELIDGIGRTVITRMADAPKINIDVSGLPAGIYLYRVTAAGMSEQGKLIKR